MSTEITSTVGCSKRGCLMFLIYPILFPILPMLYFMPKLMDWLGGLN